MNHIGLAVTEILGNTYIRMQIELIYGMIFNALYAKKLFWWNVGTLYKQWLGVSHTQYLLAYTICTLLVNKHSFFYYFLDAGYLHKCNLVLL